MKKVIHILLMFVITLSLCGSALLLSGCDAGSNSSTDSAGGGYNIESSTDSEEDSDDLAEENVDNSSDAEVESDTDNDVEAMLWTTDYTFYVIAQLRTSSSTYTTATTSTSSSSEIGGVSGWEDVFEITWYSDSSTTKTWGNTPTTNSGATSGSGYTYADAAYFSYNYYALTSNPRVARVANHLSGWVLSGYYQSSSTTTSWTNTDATNTSSQTYYLYGGSSSSTMSVSTSFPSSYGSQISSSNYLYVRFRKYWTEYLLVAHDTSAGSSFYMYAGLSQTITMNYTLDGYTCVGLSTTGTANSNYGYKYFGDIDNQVCTATATSSGYTFTISADNVDYAKLGSNPNLYPIWQPNSYYAYIRSYNTSDYTSYKGANGDGGTIAIVWHNGTDATEYSSSGEYSRSYQITFGTTTTLTATASSGYLFVGWYKSTSSTVPDFASASKVCTDATYEVDQNSTVYYYYAFFARYVTSTRYVRNRYTADWSTVSSGSTGGSVSFSYVDYTNTESSSTSVTTSTTISSSKYVLYGSDDVGTITVTASANSGYTFRGWYGSSSTSSPSSSDTPVSTSTSYTYAANAYTYMYGVFVRYMTSTMYVTNVRTLTMAAFTSSSSTGGSISWTYTTYTGSTSTASVSTYTSKSSTTRILYGSSSVSTCTVKATANAGYTFVGWYYGTSYNSFSTSTDTLLSTSTSYSYCAGAYQYIKALFARTGSLTVYTSHTADYSTITTESSTGGTVSLSYTQVTSDAVGGTTSSATISTSGSYSYATGTTTTLTATAASGYTFKGWYTSTPSSSSTASSTSAALTISSVTTYTAGVTSYTYYAFFVKSTTISVSDYYALTYSSITNGTVGGSVTISYTDLSGTAQSNVSVGASGSYDCLYGATITISASNNSGYYLRGWYTSTPSSSNYSSTASTSSSVSITPSATSYTYSALFVKYATMYVRNYYSSNLSSVSYGSTGGTVTMVYTARDTATQTTIYPTYGTYYQLYGTSVTLTATASSGYIFVGWMTSNTTPTLGCTVSSTDTTLTISAGTTTSASSTTYYRYAFFVKASTIYYDSDEGYYYCEMGEMPQTKVSDSTTLTALGKLTSSAKTNKTYTMAGVSLDEYVYGSNYYVTFNGNWYKVEPVRWRLSSGGSYSSSSVLATTASIVYLGQYSTTEVTSGSGYSTTAVDDFASVLGLTLSSYCDDVYLSTFNPKLETFSSTGVTSSTSTLSKYMYVSSLDEINSVNGSYAIEFSDLVSDMLAYLGYTNAYFTRNLGSNLNNIKCATEGGAVTQRLATNYSGVCFTITLTNYYKMTA